MKGSYTLLIELTKPQVITVGRLKAIHFAGGHYAYAGSALSGIDSRLNRHLRRDRKLHWHIDYLLHEASVNDIIACETEARTECSIAQALGREFEAGSGFGSSDCKCQSHLFFATDGMTSQVMAILRGLGMEPRLVK